PRGPPLRPARDAPVRDAGHGARVVLRVQHHRRGGHVGGVAHQGRRHLRVLTSEELREARAVALDDIYKEVILDHYKNPRNKRELPGAELRCTRNNPLCGDEITVFAHVEDGTVREVTFQGAGCSISQSSASMMTQAVGGQDVDGALALAEDFRSMI